MQDIKPFNDKVIALEHLVTDAEFTVVTAKYLLERATYTSYHRLGFKEMGISDVADFMKEPKKALRDAENNCREVKRDFINAQRVLNSVIASNKVEEDRIRELLSYDIIVDEGIGFLGIKYYSDLGSVSFDIKETVDEVHSVSFANSDNIRDVIVQLQRIVSIMEEAENS